MPWFFVNVVIGILPWRPMHPSLHRFYHPLLNDQAQQLMEGPEVHHMTKVMRLKAGEELMLLDGRGKLAHVRIEELRKEQCTYTLMQMFQGDDPMSGLHIAMAPTKQVDRMEWFLEKAVEMGIGRFTPLSTERGERERLRLDRLERIAVSAMKQSLRTHMPILDELTEINELLDAAGPENKFIAHCYEGEKQAQIIPAAPCIILIGPEGDFSLEEVALAKEKGFKALSLGAARLRTETAAMKAVALYNG